MKEASLKRYILWAWLVFIAASILFDEDFLACGICAQRLNCRTDKSGKFVLYLFFNSNFNLYLYLYLRTAADVVKIVGGTNRANDWTFCQLLPVFKQSLRLVMDKFVIFYREWHSFLWGRGETMMTMSIEGDADCPDQKPISMARQRTVNCICSKLSNVFVQIFTLSGSAADLNGRPAPWLANTGR